MNKKFSAVLAKQNGGPKLLYLVKNFNSVLRLPDFSVPMLPEYVLPVLVLPVSKHFLALLFAAFFPDQEDHEFYRQQA